MKEPTMPSPEELNRIQKENLTDEQIEKDKRKEKRFNRIDQKELKEFMGATLSVDDFVAVLDNRIRLVLAQTMTEGTNDNAYRWAIGAYPESIEGEDDEMYGLLSSTKDFIKNTNLNNQEKLAVFEKFKNKFLFVFTKCEDTKELEELKKEIKRGIQPRHLDAGEFDEVRAHLAGYEKIFTQIFDDLKEELK